MNYSELREFVVNELIEENYHKQRRESDEVNELILKRIELSEQVQDCTELLNPKAKDVLESYLDIISELETKKSEYLYIQGAKDCVVLLQELGVIR